MDPITLAIVAAGAILFGGVGAAAYVGDPDVKDRAFDRAQAKRQREIDALEAQLRERQLVGAGYRAVPSDAQALEARIEELWAEKAAAHRRYYGDSGEG